VTRMLVLTPSFGPDFELCADLNRSVLGYSPAEVRHQIIVPKNDVPLFRKLANDRTQIRTEAEFLPTSFVRAPWVNATINLRRPFPPVRGWILQQVLKLAAAADADADVVLLVDSDIEFVRPFSADTFLREGVVRFYRLPDGVDQRLPRHVAWHNGARALLGLSMAPPPMPDYVSSLLAWQPAIVRQLLDRVEQVTRRRWADAVAAQLHFSEWTLYGVYVDNILRGPATDFADDTSLCHTLWGTVPLDESTVAEFVAGMAADDVAVMISAKTHTPLAIRRAVSAAMREAASNDATRLKE
jgi:Family of unknown function (DUF6492)